MATLLPRKSGFFDAVQAVEEEDEAEARGAVPTQSAMADTATVAALSWQRREYEGGVEYEGDMMARKWHGLGRLDMGKNEEYVGEWKEGKRHGLGVYHYPDGGLYRGQWQDNVKVGFGVLVRNDGHIYVGLWDSNRPHDAGVYLFSNRDMYIGQFRAGLQHGIGMLLGQDGSRYLGQWREGKRDGLGVWSASDGSLYAGGWRSDARTRGLLVRQNQVEQVEWRGDQLICTALEKGDPANLLPVEWAVLTHLKHLSELPETLLSAAHLIVPPPYALHAESADVTPRVTLARGLARTFCQALSDGVPAAAALLRARETDAAAAAAPPPRSVATAAAAAGAAGAPLSPGTPAGGGAGTARSSHSSGSSTAAALSPRAVAVAFSPAVPVAGGGLQPTFSSRSLHSGAGGAGASSGRAGACGRRC